MPSVLRHRSVAATIGEVFMGLPMHQAMATEELVQEEGNMAAARSRGSRRRGAQLGRGQEVVVVRMEVAMAGAGSPVAGRTEQWCHWPHHILSERLKLQQWCIVATLIERASFMVSYIRDVFCLRLMG